MILTLRNTVVRRPLPVILLFMMVATIFLAACGGGANDGRPSVVATTAEMGALTRAVAGDTVTVKVLVAPGVDPHDYEASAGDVKQVGGAALVIRQGIGID